MNGQKYRNNELLDLYNIKIDRNDKRIIKRRNRTLKKIKKNKYQRWTLKYLTKNVERESKKALKYIHIKD